MGRKDVTRKLRVVPAAEAPPVEGQLAGSPDAAHWWVGDVLHKRDGTVVDLAFGILFGGIVLTLALAIGMGFRDIVSRSLERNAIPTLDPLPGDPEYKSPTEPLRHF